MAWTLGLTALNLLVLLFLLWVLSGQGPEEQGDQETYAVGFHWEPPQEGSDEDEP